MYVCVSVCTPTKGGFAPSLQADSFAVWLNKEVFHTHVLRDYYVLEGEGLGEGSGEYQYWMHWCHTRLGVRGGVCTGGEGEGHPLTDRWAT